MAVDRCMAPCPTPRPTEPITTVKPTRRPTSATYLTPEPTKKPTEDQSGWGEPQPTTKAPKTKKPKPTKAPKTKKPKPTKAPKTSKPTKAPKTKKPKPSKPPKTGKPTRKPTRDKSTYLSPQPSHTDTYLTPEPTKKPTEDQSGWGAPNPSVRVDNEEILAVDVNGVTKTSFTGYSMQTEIAGMISIGLVLLIVAYSMLCKANKNDHYIAIEEQQVV